jgi:hypothetical protein
LILECYKEPVKSKSPDTTATILQSNIDVDTSESETCFSNLRTLWQLLCLIHICNKSMVGGEMIVMAMWTFLRPMNVNLI